MSRTAFLVLFIPVLLLSSTFTSPIELSSTLRGLVVQGAGLLLLESVTFFLALHIAAPAVLIAIAYYRGRRMGRPRLWLLPLFAGMGTWFSPTIDFVALALGSTRGELVGGLGLASIPIILFASHIVPFTLNVVCATLGGQADAANNRMERTRDG
jgi:hypothetical protein